MNEAGQILDQAVAVKPTTTAPVNTTGVSTDASPQQVPQQDDKLASKLEILLKRERDAVDRERLAKQKEIEIEEKLKRITEFDSSKTNPKKALELLGLSYDELTQSLLNDGSIPPEAQVRKLEEKFEQYKSEQEKTEDARRAQAQKDSEAQEQRVIGEFKGQINQYLKDNLTRYELIQFEEQQELVYNVIDEHYTRTTDPDTGIGKVMSIQEAADKVELWLEGKYERSRGVNKIKTLWSMLPKAAQAQVEKQAKTGEPTKPRATLTNQLTATPAQPRKVPISDEERVQRAIAYAKGLRPDLR